MDRILEPVKEFAAVFIDDIHLNKQKCLFAKEQVSYLGHGISHRKIAMDPSKIEAVARIPPPADATGVERFLGRYDWILV